MVDPHQFDHRGPCKARLVTLELSRVVGMHDCKEREEQWEQPTR
jgi:hypothetical protein